MSWHIEERPNTRKFQVSDDGTARATLSLVFTCDLNDAVISRAPDSIWDALSTDFQIGTYPAVSATSWDDPFGEKWRVESYSGVQAANTEGNIWHVDVILSFAGSMAELQPITPGTPFAYRRDIEIMTGSVMRTASAYVDWYNLAVGDMPPDGDADWLASSLSYLEITNSARVDVNGRPIIMRLPGCRLTINHIHRTDIEGSIDLAQQYVGSRNNTNVFKYDTGQLLLESVETVQVGHGFQRNTYRIYGDSFFHLEQEPAVTPMDNGTIFRTTTTNISSDIVVRHGHAVWRQPYRLTTDSGWDLSDLFPDADDRAYINSLL
tara:strand:+ start:3415 stop:4377 length:963 start_codon:yes stop_codon:yes gene_type:complete